MCSWIITTEWTFCSRRTRSTLFHSFFKKFDGVLEQSPPGSHTGELQHQPSLWMVYRGVAWLFTAVPELHVTLGWLLSHGQNRYYTTHQQVSLVQIIFHFQDSLSPKTSFLAPNNEWLRLTSALMQNPSNHLHTFLTSLLYINTVSKLLWVVLLR